MFPFLFFPYFPSLIHNLGGGRQRSLATGEGRDVLTMAGEGFEQQEPSHLKHIGIGRPTNDERRTTIDLHVNGLRLN